MEYNTPVIAKGIEYIVIFLQNDLSNSKLGFVICFVKLI